MIAYFKMPGANTLYHATYEMGDDGPEIHEVYGHGDISDLFSMGRLHVMIGRVAEAHEIARRFQQDGVAELGYETDASGTFKG